MLTRTLTFLSLTSALNAGEWSPPRPGRFTLLKETLYSHFTKKRHTFFFIKHLRSNCVSRDIVGTVYHLEIHMQSNKILKVFNE